MDFLNHSKSRVGRQSGTPEDGDDDDDIIDLESDCDGSSDAGDGDGEGSASDSGKMQGDSGHEVSGAGQDADL